MAVRSLRSRCLSAKFHEHVFPVLRGDGILYRTTAMAAEHGPKTLSRSLRRGGGKLCVRRFEGWAGRVFEGNSRSVRLSIRRKSDLAVGSDTTIFM